MSTKEKRKGGKDDEKGERELKKIETNFVIPFFYQFWGLSLPQNRTRDLQFFLMFSHYVFLASLEFPLAPGS